MKLSTKETVREPTITTTTNESGDSKKQANKNKTEIVDSKNTKSEIKKVNLLKKNIKVSPQEEKEIDSEISDPKSPQLSKHLEEKRLKKQSKYP